MRALLILSVLAIASPAAAQRIYRPGEVYQRPQYQVYQRPAVVQQNAFQDYRYSPRLRQPDLWGYSYGQNIYGNYTSAFDPSPVFVQPVVVDQYYYGY